MKLPVQRLAIVLIAACATFGSARAQNVDECAILRAEPANPAPEQVTAGPFAFSVHSSRWSQEVLAGPRGEPLPHDVLLVDIEARNTGDGMLGVPWADLRHPDGTKSGAALKSTLMECSFRTAPLAPGASTRAYMVFDVTKADGYKLLLYGTQDDQGTPTGDPVEVVLQPK